MTDRRKILISAAGINSGGGFVLFESLFRALKNVPTKTHLDIRLSSRYANFVDDGLAVIVKKNFFSRVASNIRLSLEGRSQDVLFSFNSLPPLVRSKAFTVTYIHSPQFVGLHKNSTYNFRDRLRFFVEINWFRFFYKNSDVLWVQTESMKALLVKQTRNVPVEVVPFIDDLLTGMHGTGTSVPDVKAVQNDEYSLFYPAAFAGHKNHICLVEAFRKLANSHPKVTLVLTLSAGDFSELVGQEPLYNVLNIGVVTREEVIARMKASSALIFPSKAETFGIPLIEASVLGLPIIASELDFVRDVCTPVETFDPNSIDAIVDAVARFTGGNNKVKRSRLLSADEFVLKLYQI